MRHIAWLAGGFLAIAAVAADLGGLFPGGLDHPAIQYAGRPVDNAVARLNRRLEEGKARLRFDGPQGYLRSVLQALEIPVESQVVVFSKTSLQARIISPANPRTIFFNESVSAAWVRGEPFVELAAEDPRQGVIFYTLDQNPAEPPRFARRDFCLSCHESYSSLGVPGMLSRSVFPGRDGAPLRQFGDYLIDHRSPWEQRWGGYYVTGKSASLRHMGNGTIAGTSQPESLLTLEIPSSLQGKFETDAYLSPYSDIVALQVFEHQMHMTNLLTRAGWEVRAALHDGKRDALDRILSDTARELVDYMLFIDEVPLPGRVQSTSGFAEKFVLRGPRDSRGRSLRELNLENRLMRYPCSFMIYGEAFDGLPEEMRGAIYRRMWQVLSGKETDRRYARLSLSDRTAILEILRDTKEGLPVYFKP
jgi:hypothetical protein